jgi:hypothetical protein
VSSPSLKSYSSSWTSCSEETVLSLGTAPCQKSKRSSSSFRTSYKEREFLRSLDCSFYSPVLWYPFLCGAVISSPVPSADLTAKRNNDVKSSHNCIPFIHIHSVFKRLPIMCRCPASAFTGRHPPKVNYDFLKNSSNDLDSISVSYENHSINRCCIGGILRKMPSTSPNTKCQVFSRMVRHGLKVSFFWNVCFWGREQCDCWAHTTQSISYKWSIYASLADGLFHCWRIQIVCSRLQVHISEQNRPAISHPSIHVCVILWDKNQPNVVL